MGQLVIRGATVMRGYWEKPEATAKKLKPGPLPGEMVLHTGDFCRLDDEGYLYFVGRMDDIIKSRGEKVAPKEVENVLYNISGVRDAAVIGVPDDILGQAVKAFVVLEAGVTLDREGHPARVPGQARELHGAEVRRDRRRPAEDDHRQDQEDRPEVSDDAEWTTCAKSTSREAWKPGTRPSSASSCCAGPARSCRGPRPSCSAARRSRRCRRPATAPRVIDVCCGAGNLACAIAVHVPAARVWATDLTDGCVGWTRRNVEHLGLGDRVTVRQGDLFAALGRRTASRAPST